VTSLAHWIGEPGSRPWARALAIGAGLLFVPLVWWSVLALTPYRAPPPEAGSMTLALALFAAVIVAPLLETFALALLHAVMVSWLKWPRVLFAAAAVGLAVAAHAPLSLARAPVTAVLFAVFACQYAGWLAKTGRHGLVFAAVAVSHAVYNLGAIVLSPLWAYLLKAA
jgi:hypothetical protein